MSAISVRDLRKTYPRTLKSAPFEALKGISFDVAEGETFGFIGPNGAGKSTAIKILLGIVTATEGSAHIFGKPVNDPSCRQHLGYVPENASLHDYLTPLEILTMGVRLHGLKLADERKHCLEWLDRFGLTNVANKTIRGFSKGMAQRTALAHALAVEPRLLVLDEPLSGLDPVGRKDVVDILDDYRKSGGSLFFSSHVLFDVERIADRFGLIHQGEMHAVSSPSDLLGTKQQVVLRTLGEAELPGFRLEPGGRWSAEVSREELWHVLDKVRQAGHTVLEIKPTLSLEAVFFKVLGKS